MVELSKEDIQLLLRAIHIAAEDGGIYLGHDDTSERRYQRARHIEEVSEKLLKAERDA